jgi:hypothetical protein
MNTTAIKTQILTKDGFAKFMLGKALKLTMYNFDVFYDIKFIMVKNDEIIKQATKENDNRYPTDSKIQSVFYWFVRDTGCDLLHESDLSLYDAMDKNCKEAFKLSFLVNCEYFSWLEFCQIETIK